MGWRGRVLVVVLWIQLLASCAHARRPLYRAPREAPTTGNYIVMLKDGTTKEQLRQVLARVVRMTNDGKAHGCIENVAKAFTVKLSPYMLEVVRHMKEVDFVEQEGMAVGYQVENLPWHIDRIDQRHLPLDYFYRPIGDGQGVDVYILDSGINYHHEEFEYRAKYSGYDPVDDYEQEESDFVPRRGLDCHGHGTHVASICGGKTYGIARRVTLYSVRVLQCHNAAPWSTVLDGLDYVSQIIPQRRRPAVVSMSLGGSYYEAVSRIMERLYQEGIHMVVAAGNGKRDACQVSPASSDRATTVGGTNEYDNLYLRGSGTNYGECVDIFAPGEHVLAASHSCGNCSKYLSGTSMATPLVSGVAAVLLSRQPLLSPDELKQKLISNSAVDLIDFNGIPSSFRSLTPNRMVQLLGSCGGNVYVLSRTSITSPNYPNSYPPHLHCVWTIEADEGQNVQMNITHFQMEQRYDSVTVYNGHCCNQSNVIVTLSGYVHPGLVFRSGGRVLTLVMTTDGIGSGPGFNATYSKLYARTDLTVPDPPITLPTSPPSTQPQRAAVRYFNRYPARNIRDLVAEWTGKGFKVVWICPYRVGPALKPYFDVIFHNSSEFSDYEVFVELAERHLHEKISEMAAKGKSLILLNDRYRNRRDIPIYSAIFSRVPEIIETEVYLRDDVATYQRRLAEKLSQGYQLISHTWEELSTGLESSTVYIRDRRLAFNITVDNLPRWESRVNLTFYDFTVVTLTLGRNHNMYPRYVEVYNIGSNTNSLFAAIYEERDASTSSNWFRWGGNTTHTLNTVINGLDIWDPTISTGYNYFGSISHFIQFKRRLRF